jgi:endonuclease YncB( thermonuclease family)
MTWPQTRTAVLAFLVAVTAPAVAGDGFRVVDGDGLRQGKERVRLWGIDAPELDQTCERDGAVYPCGEVAADMLQAFVGSEPVACVEVEKDRYGRTVARCQVGGVDLGALMVGAGWAVDFERYSGGHYAPYQDAAKQAGRGLWHGSFAMPWDWRKNK